MVALLLGVCSWSPPAAAKAPVRSVNTIAWAIGIDHGHIPLSTRRVYAKAIRAVGIQYDFDGFTAVALIQHESRFRTGAIGDDGDAVGLAQIHYKYLCSSPKSCAAKRLSLLDPVANIQSMGRLIDLKRAWCRKHTGKPALFTRWLHAYGFNQYKDLKCNQDRTKTGWKDRPVPTELQTIIRYRRNLIGLLKKKRRSKRRRS